MPNRMRPAKSRLSDPPSSFKLEAHARLREAWNLGDEMAVEAIVELRGTGGAIKAAVKLGQSVRGAPSQRRFEVRRLEAFARWLLAFGGDAVPLHPSEMVECFYGVARKTLDVYHGVAQ